jgi:hypothetical protein
LGLDVSLFLADTFGLEADFIVDAL